MFVKERIGCAATGVVSVTLFSADTHLEDNLALSVA
jgi:hypothetical protein